YRFLLKFDLRKKNIRSKEEAPVFHKFHKDKSSTPTMGGVIIWGTVILMAVVFWILAQTVDGFFEYFNFIDRAETYLPLAALLIAALVGLADDLFGLLGKGPKGGGLSMKKKIVLYTSVAVIGSLWFYFRLGWDTLYVPFFGYFNIGAWYIPVFIFILAATAFSTNETDGLDGLAAGVLFFSFAALAVVAFVLGRYELTAMIAAILGSLLAFLWFNIYPAKFFMGDTGSMSLGITLGVIAMLTNTALLLPFFAFILIMESLSVIVQLTSKRFRGKKIFHSTPIHHHFEALGWHESQITMRFWIISAAATTLGLVVFFLARFA
ncbi:MAG: phospho-N-acetylmuramoyl-pentapeptide-transferase, partial [Candidatus Paceibacterota bacterium]